MSEPEAKVRDSATALVIYGTVKAVYAVVSPLISLGVMAYVSRSSGMAPGANSIFGDRGQQLLLFGNSFLGVITGSLIIYGGMQMRLVRSRRWAIAASVIACVFCWDCCCLGLPVGIIALVVLFDDQVKATFERARATAQTNRGGAQS